MTRPACSRGRRAQQRLPAEGPPLPRRPGAPLLMRREEAVMASGLHPLLLQAGSRRMSW